MANGDSHHRPFRSIGSGYGCIRHTFCLLNAAMWLCGCGLLGVGLWLRFAYGGYASLLSNYQGLSADGLCITAGAIAAIIAGCGCAGACFQNRCLLMTYFSSVAFAFLLELIVMVLCFIFKIELGETLVSELNAGVRQHYNRTNSLAITWDHIQQEFDCCGVQSYTDWYSIAAWPDEAIVPDSCCLPWVTNSTDCGRSGQPSLWHRAGCYEVLHIWLLERLHLLGIAALVLAFVQLFGMVSSMMLYCTLGFKRKRFYTYRSYQPAS